MVQTHNEEQNLFDVVIRKGLLGVIFLLPLVFSRFFDLCFLSLPWLYTNIVFQLPKVVFFCVAVDVFFLLFLISMCWYRTSIIIPKLSRTFVTWIIGLVVVLVASTVFSPVPIISFFGSYERGLGLLTWLHYILFFILVVTHFQRNDILRIFRVITWSALFVGLYGVLQSLHMDPISIWSEDALKGRIFSTLGHPSYLGYFFIFTIPVAIYELYLLLPQQKIFSKMVVSISLFCQIFSLWLSGSRGGLLGLIIAGIFLFVCDQIVQKKYNNLRRGIILVGSFLILCVALVSFVPSIRSSFRFDTENMRSVEARMYIWKDVSFLALERPLLGYGLDTLTLFHPTLKSPELLDLENYTQSADRAHNIILDWFYATGVFGLACYLGFFGVLLVSSFRLVKDEKYRLYGIVFGSGIVAFFLSNLWGFPIVVHDVYFWLFASMICLVSYDEKKIGVQKKYWIAIPLGLLLLVSMRYHVNVYRADHYFFEGVTERTVDNFQKSVDHAPWMPLYHAVLASVEKNSEEIMQANALTNQHDWSYRLQEIEMFAPQGNSKQSIAELSAQFPTIPQIYDAWGQLLISQQAWQSCVDVYEKVLALGPFYWKYDTELLTMPYAERERYRLFFKENPLFRTYFAQISQCALAIGNTERVFYYAPHMEERAEKYSILSKASAKSGKAEDAKKYFDKCLEMGDNTLCQSSD